MNYKQIEVISCLMDIVIIFSPFLLLVNSGVQLFLWSFYFIYLPYLVFNVYKYNNNKRKRHEIDSELKKISQKDFVIHQ
jgi:amino acid transporter